MMQGTLIAGILFLVQSLYAGDGRDHAGIKKLEGFAEIPVLSNGRIVPLDSYARFTLLRFSGKSTYKRGSALTWLGQVLFAPETTEGDEIFKINNDEVLTAIGVRRQKKRRYSFNELTPGFATLSKLAYKASKVDDKKRSPVERELLSLYYNMTAYEGLMASFDFALPMANFTITDSKIKAFLNLPQAKERFSFMEIYQRRDVIRATVSSSRQKEQEEKSYIEIMLSYMEQDINHWLKKNIHSSLFIVPVEDHPEGKWLTPRDLFIFSTRFNSFGPQLQALATLAGTYYDNNQTGFTVAVQNFNQLIKQRHKELIQPSKLNLEISYNRLDPFYRSELCFGLAVLALLISFVLWKSWLYRAGMLLIAGGIILTAVGIIERMIIMGRPPVTNLFSTFVFVGFTSALLGLVMEYFQKNKLGVLVGAFSGLVLLLISNKYVAEGDTMGVLVAVLDSNFWLATHVITISVGYAGCCVSGVIGHIYLLQLLFNNSGASGLRATYRAMYGTMAFGLIFSFIGTVLGGIWADQSWGRFWGWDPKENGALLIVLWCSVLFHARIGNMIKEAGFAFGSIVGVIVVMLAWFGINLLGVGLHSYGFTSGIAAWLLVYIVFELLFIMITGLLIQKMSEKMQTAVQPAE